MDELTKEFLVESYDNLEQVDIDLVTLEGDPSNREVLDRVFRAIHTIKGTCGFLGYSNLEAITHRGENLLDKLRGGQLELNEEIANGLLAMVDAVRSILTNIEATEAEGDADHSKLLEELTRLLEGEPGIASSSDTEADESVVELEASSAESAPPEVELESDLGDAAVPAPSVPATEPIATAKSPTPASESSSPKGGRVAESSIRVGVTVLDHLMDLVGELVLARNQVLQYSEQRAQEELDATLQRLDLITNELQVEIMKTRMQPIGNIWNKFPRIVRDLSHECGKRIGLEMRGTETEIDRTLIEAIKDPLTHIIRNSVDHGVEAPEARRAKGKPEEGSIVLRAYHEGGMVNIEIRDDGGGIRLDRVREKAIERGLITRDQGDRMSERELLALILTPGFSTAEKITNVSGRGVGMDVVRTNIEAIGGSLDVTSKVDIGTTLRVKVPLTLAIIPALVVTSRGQRFALPQVTLRELVRLEGEGGARDVEMLHGAPVYRLRGQLLPLVHLNDELQLPACEDPDRKDKGAVNIVVLEAEGRTFGLIVDVVNDTQEIVVKPLGKVLSQLDCYAGSTIMGDGTVALILDTVGLARRAYGASGEAERGKRIGEEQPVEEELGESQSVLIFSTREGQRMAVPTKLISRLEEVDSSFIESAGTSCFLQYRGGIMRLVDLSKILGVGRRDAITAPEDLTLQVLVFSGEDGDVGLMVSEILDIVDTRSRPSLGKNRRHGVEGLMVIDGKITELLDVEAVVQPEASSDFLENAARILESTAQR